MVKSCFRVASSTSSGAFEDFCCAEELWPVYRATPGAVEWITAES